MAYQFLTQYDSPNYTPAGQARATWGRERTIEKIVIHWWNDPSLNPTFEGVVAHLCNPNAQVSAHFVATGTGRRVACLVAPKDAAWSASSANPYTIAIECDPRCRDEDYDVVGELVAELRATYGNLPLIGHNSVVNTRCPGNYDLNRINTVAATKIANPTDQFGLARDKVAPAPAPAPKPVDETIALKARITELETALKNEQNKPPQEVIKEVIKIVEKPVEVVRTEYIHDEETKENVSQILRWVKSIWGLVMNLFKR